MIYVVYFGGKESSQINMLESSSSAYTENSKQVFVRASLKYLSLLAYDLESYSPISSNYFSYF